MIKQFLQRDFMLKSANNLKRSIEETINNSESSISVQRLLQNKQVTTTELQAASAELQEAIVREERRAQGKEDHIAFFTRDPVMSLVQTALQEYSEVRKPSQILQKSDEIRAASPQGEIPIADRELTEGLSEFLSQRTQRGLFNDFELADIGWANCLLAISLRNWRGPYPFNHQPATPYRIGNHARVILFSDWGSGLPRAQKVGEAIRKELLDPAAKTRDKHVIHLGDVYYSGWVREYEQNFLPYWPVHSDEADHITSWSLNANHDMYSGGKGYFDFLLNDTRFNTQEHSSFFSLENDRWLLLGVDTGYHQQNIFDPHDLYGEQNRWVHERLSKASDKTGVLLSHHQPFSAFEKGGEKLLDKLGAPLSEKLIRAWFWGHEHRCAFYEERANIAYPRCIGYGGIPFYVADGPLPADDGVIYEYRDGFDDLLESWNYFGFVVLDFEEASINVRYINERGKQHQQEIITRNQPLAPNKL